MTMTTVVLGKGDWSEHSLCPYGRNVLVTLSNEPLWADQAWAPFSFLSLLRDLHVFALDTREVTCRKLALTPPLLSFTSCAWSRIPPRQLPSGSLE